MHRTSEQFRKCFNRLPQRIQQLSRREFLLLKEDSRHPSLHFKKLGKFWSIRVGLNYRALAVEDGADYIWVWIGTHDEYDRLVANQD